MMRRETEKFHVANGKKIHVIRSQNGVCSRVIGTVIDSL